MWNPIRLACAALACLMAMAGPGSPEAGEVEAIAARIVAPYALGPQIDPRGVWTLLDGGGGDAGYVIETGRIAPIPGFSGAPIDLLVVIDREGQFIDAQIVAQNEPVFVSGLGPGPFHEFVRQYRGHSLHDAITVGAPYGAAERATSTNVYLDGVTKATASVRIANETALAAALDVARTYLQGRASGPGARPDPDHAEPLDWAGLLAEGAVARLDLTNAEADAAFAGTLWADDDPAAKADPGGLYAEIRVVDVGPPAVARALLAQDTLAELGNAVTPDEEAILVLANGRHPLVAPDYVRNTAPDRLGAAQGGLPVALRDADMAVTLAPGVPEFEQAMMLRIDRRLGFDPASLWQMSFRAVRAHGMFLPEMGTRDFAVEVRSPQRFFTRPVVAAPPPPWLAGLRDRAGDLVALALLLGLGLWLMARRMRWLAAWPAFPALRLGALAVMTVFVGWWGQGQLSIVTPLGIVRAGVERQSLAFLLYDPFSLVIWAVTLASLAVWGRGFFCGWLCPYGALQEFAHQAGRLLRLPQPRVPARLDRRLKRVKYGVLAALVVAALGSAAAMDLLVEVEPFKTAITLGFVRDPAYVAYAAFWLVLGLFVFKGFCRWVCPLGALLALGGLLRRHDWIARRAECGSPCQLCAVRCKYGAIRRGGGIDYDECFQCLDCVTIHDDPKTCVPLVLAARQRPRAAPLPEPAA